MMVHKLLDWKRFHGTTHHLCLLWLLAALSLVSSALAQPAITDADLVNQERGLTITTQEVRTHHDRVPRLCQNPTRQSAASGSFGAGSTWQGGVAPSDNDVVWIRAGHVVTFDSANSPRIRCIEIQSGGRLTFAPSVDTRLRIGTILVMPQGRLSVGTSTFPIPADRRAIIEILSQPLDTGTTVAPGLDYEQFGTGILVFGAFESFGAAKRTTFASASGDLAAGSREIELLGSVDGWQAGDELYIADSRQLSPEQFANFSERIGDFRRVANVRPNGPGRIVVTLDNPLSKNAPCARFPDSVNRNTRSLVRLEDGTPLCTHVGNQSRNVIIQSENPLGVRGHIAFFNRAVISLFYTEFRDLGRTLARSIDNAVVSGSSVTKIGTNQNGRYPVHWHHVVGPESDVPGLEGTQGRIVGCSVRSVNPQVSTPANPGIKWGVVMHGSHYMEARENVITGLTGAGLVLGEDGNERGNRGIRNFVAAIVGAGGNGIQNSSEFFNLDDRSTSAFAGFEGAGIWFRSAFLGALEGNVVANTAIGINKFMIANGTVTIPLRRGADPHAVGGGQVRDFGEQIFDGKDGVFAINDVVEGNTAFSNFRGFEMWSGTITLRRNALFHNSRSGLEGRDGVKHDELWERDASGRKNYVIGDLDLNETRLDRHIGLTVGEGYLINLDLRDTVMAGLQLGISNTANNSNKVSDSLLWNRFNWKVRPNTTNVERTTFRAPTGLTLVSMDYRDNDEATAFTHWVKRTQLSSVRFETVGTSRFVTSAEIYANSQAGSFVIWSERGECNTQFHWKGANRIPSKRGDCVADLPSELQTVASAWTQYGAEAVPHGRRAPCDSCTTERQLAQHFGIPDAIIADVVETNPPPTPTPVVVTATPIPSLPPTIVPPPVTSTPVATTPATSTPFLATATPSRPPPTSTVGSVPTGRVPTAVPTTSRSPSQTPGVPTNPTPTGPAGLSLSVECIVPCGDREQNSPFIAVFSYRNGTESAITVPVGARNLVQSGAAPVAAENLPEKFLPGVHRGALSAVSNTGAPVEWSVATDSTPGTVASAVASSGSPKCDALSFGVCQQPTGAGTQTREFRVEAVNFNRFELLIPAGVCGLRSPQSSSAAPTLSVPPGSRWNLSRLDSSDARFGNSLLVIGKPLNFGNVAPTCPSRAMCWETPSTTFRTGVKVALRRISVTVAGQRRLRTPIEELVRATQRSLRGFPRSTWHCLPESGCADVSLGRFIEPVRDSLEATLDELRVARIRASRRASSVLQSLRRTRQAVLELETALGMMPQVSAEAQCARWR